MNSLSSWMADEWDDTPLNPTSLEAIFSEEPVPLQTFIRDKKFLGEDWNLSPIQENAVRHIERVYLPELFPKMAAEWGSYWDDTILMKNILTLQWGKGSGKDHVCRIASLRVAYMLLCMKSPQLYFGMPEHDSIHMLNIAVNSAQANRAFFTPLKNYVKRPWFRDKADPKRDYIQYDKNLIAISGHSDAESQEGLNLILGVADEIDAFKARDEMVGLGKRAREASTSAESILKMLKGSASTRFPYSYKRVAISYPRYLGSTIQLQTAEAVEDIEKYGDKDSIYFASGPFATWVVNPLRKGKEDFSSDYRKDPDEAAAMYECRPTRAVNSYFKNMPIFRQAIDKEDQPLSVDYKLFTTTSKVTGKPITGWEPVFSFAPDFKPVQGAIYALHGDLAINGDRAGIAMSHVESYEERTDIVLADDGEEFTQQTVAPIIRNDFTFGFTSDVSARDDSNEPLPREIQIRWARMLCFELIKRGFFIGSFTFDGFQSADTIQILLSHGIESERVSTDRDPDIWKTIKDVASDSRLRMPHENLLLIELEALSKLDNGKIDHPPGGSKDLADAFACSIIGAIAVGGSEDPEGSIVVIGDPTFAVGSALAPLEGSEFVSNGVGDPFGLPIGMKGLGF